MKLSERLGKKMERPYSPQTLIGGQYQIVVEARTGAPRWGWSDEERAAGQELLPPIVDVTLRLSTPLDEQAKAYDEHNSRQRLQLQAMTAKGKIEGGFQGVRLYSHNNRDALQLVETFEWIAMVLRAQYTANTATYEAEHGALPEDR